LDKEGQISTVVPLPQSVLLTETALLKARKPPQLKAVLSRMNGVIPPHKQYLSTLTLAKKAIAEERTGMASCHQCAPQDDSCALCHFPATLSWLCSEYLPFNIMCLAQNGCSTLEKLISHFNCQNKSCPN